MSKDKITVVDMECDCSNKKVANMLNQLDELSEEESVEFIMKSMVRIHRLVDMDEFDCEMIITTDDDSKFKLALKSVLGEIENK